jgi:non-heme chloroperoxidase
MKDYVEKKVSLPSGTTISFVANFDDATLLQKSPIVFLHGYLDSWHSWRLVMDLYGESPFVSLSLPGWGNSDHSWPAEKYSISSYAQVVAEFLDSTLNLSKVKVHLVGHSMGSIVTHKIASDVSLQQHLKSATLVGSGPRLKGDREVMPGTTFQDILNVIDTWDKPDEKFLLEFQGVDPMVDSGAISKEFRDDLMTETYKAPLSALKEGWRALIADNHVQDLGAIDVPTLVIWGDKDEVFIKSEQDELLELIRGSKLVTIEGGPHGVQWTHPKQVFDAIEEFIAKHR